MIRVYSFYSVGGYKDMYLGNISPVSVSSYYLPLLPIMKKRSLVEERAKVEELDALPKIQIITKKDSYGFPSECSSLFSHGGYLIMYKTLSTGETCLAIRNLDSTTKDEEGRSTPFNLLFIADTQEDSIILDRVAIYCTTNASYINDILSPTIVYDAHVNGLRADLYKIYEWVQSCIDLTIGELQHYPNRINYLMVADSLSISIVLKEHDIIEENIDAILKSDGTVLQGELRFLPKQEIFSKNITDSKLDEKVISVETNDDIDIAEDSIPEIKEFHSNKGTEKDNGDDSHEKTEQTTCWYKSIYRQLIQRIRYLWHQIGSFIVSITLFNHPIQFRNQWLLLFILLVGVLLGFLIGLIF